jgi:plastocyanin
MWHPLRRMSALSLALGLLAVAAGGCTVNHSDGAGGAKPGTPQPTEVTRQIVIDNFTFDPPTLTVSVGTRVSWVNRDDVPHTATSTAKPKLFDSGALDSEGQFTHVFTAPGTYEYFCAVHPKMTGRVVVK